MIKKVKNGKAAGLDRISNEMKYLVLTLQKI